jgi:uncharacterized protein (TIGR03435 family)
MWTYKSHTVLLFLVLVCSPRVTAQDQPATPSEYEVASVKPVVPNVPHMVGVRVYPGGRLVLTTLSLRSLAAVAFGVSYWQVSGGDVWTEKDEYDLEAKPTENLRSKIKDLRYTNFSIEDEHLRKMLQAVLIDRFQLKFHREIKTGAVYLLQRNANALPLRPAKSPSSDAEDSAGRGSIGYVGGTWGIFATTMPQLARFAADHILRAPVLDRTDLAGPFDYKQSVPDAEPNYTNNSESFLNLVKELGLKLQRSRGPVETLVIDQASKPSSN